MITADGICSGVVITASNGQYTYRSTINGTSATIVINRPGTYRLTASNGKQLNPSSININRYGQIEYSSLWTKYYILNGSYLKSPAYIRNDYYYDNTITHTSDGIHVKNNGDRYAFLSIFDIYEPRTCSGKEIYFECSGSQTTNNKFIVVGTYVGDSTNTKQGTSGSLRIYSGIKTIGHFNIGSISSSDVLVEVRFSIPEVEGFTVHRLWIEY